MNRLLRDGRLSNGRRVDIQVTDGLISGVVDSQREHMPVRIVYAPGTGNQSLRPYELMPLRLPENAF